MRFSLVFSSLLSVALATTCTNNAGLGGTCISTSSCSSGGGSSEAGHCPGDASIQCCTYGTCTANGVAGKCGPTSMCSGTSSAGHCPGPSDIQCCTTSSSSSGGSTGGSCTNNAGLAGTCISTSSCSSNGGSSEAGHCPGDASIQCCTYGTCSGGTCGPTSACSGTSTPGLCPGPSNIQCCSSGSSSGGGSGGSGALPGLNSVQSAHAHVIASVAHSAGVGKQGCIIAIATGMVESSIRVLANPTVPASQNYPHDGEGSDHDSVGIFQQRPIYWCPSNVDDCMDPASSANKFYTALKGVSGWQSMSVGDAAQAVQKSAFPDRYQTEASLATNVCNAAY